MKLHSFPSRAWILIRPALQTAVLLPPTLSMRHIRCTGTSDAGTGAEPVMAKRCQKWPHLCQFEIKERFIVWTSTVNVLSNLLHLHICCGPLVCSLSCKWNVSLLMWGFVWRLTVQHTAHVCRAAGSVELPFRSLISFWSQCLLAPLCYSLPCYFASLLFA